MLSRHATMGILLLRATSTLAWAPGSLRLTRYGRFGADICGRCRSSTSPTATTTAAPLHRSSSNGRGSSGRRGLRTFATLSTTETGEAVNSEDGARQGSSSDEVGNGELSPGTAGRVSISQRGGSDENSSSVVEIQPLLQRHMEILGSPAGKKIKTRQHVNPLAATFQEPVVLPERWFQSTFRDPTAPLLVDIGCAKGSFVRDMARAQPERNYLGLEIRRPTAAVALERAAKLGTRNCHVVCCNANVDLDAVLTEAVQNGASIDTICIQFPDPHFKTKHYKRRVMQPELVTCIEKHLGPGGTLFMQSDVLDVAEDMRIITRETAQVLEDARPDMEDWMEGPDKNPFGVQTEREKVTYEKESAEENRVYRCVFVKKEAS